MQHCPTVNSFASASEKAVPSATWSHTSLKATLSAVEFTLFPALFRDFRVLVAHSLLLPSASSRLHGATLWAKAPQNGENIWFPQPTTATGASAAAKIAGASLLKRPISGGVGRQGHERIDEVTHLSQGHFVGSWYAKVSLKSPNYHNPVKPHPSPRAPSGAAPPSPRTRP
jgi:hypothetical protein